MKKGTDIILQKKEDTRMLHYAPSIILSQVNACILELEETLEKTEDKEQQKKMTALLFLWQDIRNILDWAVKHIKVGEKKDGKTTRNKS